MTIGPVLLLRISLSAVALLILLMAALAWRRSGRVTGARTIALLMASAVIYCFGYAQELAQTDLNRAWFWLHVEYLGIPWLPALWLLLARKHLGLHTRIWLLSIVPAVTMVAQWSNSLHGLYDSSSHLVYRSPFWIVQVQRAPFAWLNLAYLYGAFLYGICLYLSSFRSAPRSVRIQTGVIFCASLPPLIGSALSFAGASPWGLDLAPLAMGLSAILAYVAVFDLECFDMVPMARSLVFHRMRDAVLITDMRHRLVDYNLAAENLFPALGSTRPGEPIGSLLGENSDLGRIFRTHGALSAIELERAGEPHTFEVNVLPLGEELYQSGWAAILADITDQMRLLQELQHSAETDVLTGIANRRCFIAAAEQERSRMARHPGPFSVVLVDVDHFKAINDACGHATGDSVLQVVAAQIENCLRGTDTLGRIGGDEFAVLLPQTCLESALELAERICLAVGKEAVLTDAGRIPVTLSLGVAAYSPADPESWRQILEQADQALYLAKAGGRNRVVAWNQTLAPT
jgi:diguanylate cyclase (GGDEF)-like protein